VMQDDTPTTVPYGAVIDTAAPEATPAAQPAPAAAVQQASVVVSAREAVPALTVNDPALRDQLALVLNRGADLTIAADGFDDTAEFAAVAYAARNTGVPFMLLKHRVVDEGMSLADAIEASQPTLNGVLEAERASAEAWADLARIAG